MLPCELDHPGLPAIGPRLDWSVAETNEIQRWTTLSTAGSVVVAAWRLPPASATRSQAIGVAAMPM